MTAQSLSVTAWQDMFTCPRRGIEMRAIGRQLDQMNATVFARQERSDIGAFVVWGIVPNDVNDTFVSVSGLDLGQ